MDFSIVRLDAKITFHRDHNNEINLLKIHQAGQVVEAPRLRPFDETSVELSDYIGRFYCEELATEYSLMVENSKLIATHDRWGEIYLRPIQDGIFLGDWWLLERIEFQRDEKNVVNGCKISCHITKELSFKKVI